MAALCRAAATAARLLLLQVIIVVADAVMDFAVALKRQDVGADAVQEIAVVAHHQHHAGERDQRLLQHAQRRQVEIVRRLVEDEEVAAVFQDAREQQPAALAAAQVFHLRRDAVVGEQKPLEIGAQRNLAVAEDDELRAVADFLQHRAFLAQLQPALVHVVELRELAGLHRAFGGRELADDDFEQRGFAEAVPPADADALAVLEREIEPAKQRAPAEVHAEIAQLDDAIAQLRRRRDAQLHVLLDHRPVLRGRLRSNARSGSSACCVARAGPAAPRPVPFSETSGACARWWRRRPGARPCPAGNRCSCRRARKTGRRTAPPCASPRGRENSGRA